MPFSLNLNPVTLAVSATLGFASLLGTYYLLSGRKKKIPRTWIEVGSVTKLLIYPLKSGRRIEIQKGNTSPIGLVTVEENGIRLRDRAFVVYGESNNEFKTGRTYPNLLKIECSPHDKDHVVFDAPDQRPLYVKVPRRESSKVTQISLHAGEIVETLDCGDEAAAWISKYLEKPGSRIGFHDGEIKRELAKVPKPLKGYKNLKSESMGAYSDLCGFHLINQASIDKLNEELEEPITANNYRPNFLIQGKIPAFSEETWDYVKVGNAIFENVKPCTRCVFTTIDPETAIRAKNREPLKTLERLNVLKDPAHIASEGNAPVMGIYLGLLESGEVNVGDRVYVPMEN